MTNKLYDRAERIPSWDQSKLTGASVTIVGSDTLGETIAAGLTALGIGKIRTIGNTDGNAFLSQKGGSASKNMIDTLNKINPNIEIKGIYSEIVSESSTVFFNKADIVIDATNDIDSKNICLSWCRKNKALFISASVSDTKGTMSISSIKETFQGEQDLVLSEIIGGIVLDETRKYLMPRPNEKLTSSVSISKNAGKGKIKRVLMVGAGALGNFCGLGLINSNIEELIIADGDTIEDTNLNRQILYYNKVGEKKANILCQRLSQLNKKTEYKPLLKFFDKSNFKIRIWNKPDLIIDATDNFKIRALLNEMSVKYNVPLVSGGTSPFEGQTMSCIPFKTQCLNCRININELAAKGKSEDAGCTRRPEGSVIISNMIIGGLMAKEVNDIINGNPTDKVYKYISNDPARVGLIGADSPCRCYKEGWTDWFATKLKALKLTGN
jgi:molybdopterin/thiamine biosynthesis adenylyltransferase